MAQQNKLPDESDRIRSNSDEEINRRIDRYTEDNIRYYASQSEESITERIDELEEEWDIDRLVQACISAGGLTTILFGVLGSRKWWLITTAALAMLGNHAVNGWCPSSSLFRRLGYRTRQEIDREKFALKALRGDFDETLKKEGVKMDDRILAAIQAVKTL